MYRLKNENFANQKLAISKTEIIETDAEGIVEVKDKAIADSLLASGFVAMKVVKAKPVAKVDKPVETVDKPVETEKPMVADSKPKWMRNKK